VALTEHIQAWFPLPEKNFGFFPQEVQKSSG
jgi:hypothetical protein